MNFLSAIALALIWLLEIALFVGTGSHAAITSASQATAKRDLVSPATVLLHYENRLIHGEINKAPLGKVLEELKRKTKVQVYLNAPSIASWPVSTSLKKVPLAEGIKIILDGFSYVLYPVNNSLAVVVLSTHPDKSSPATKINPRPFINPTRHEVPQSLEEFQPLEEYLLASQVEAEDSAMYPSQLAAEHEYSQALIDRALNALSSEHTHLYEDAINQLVGIEDPQATQILVEAANTGMGPVSRTRAVEELWRHAVNLQFEDVDTINALQQLANDNDNSVSSIARKALLEMQDMGKSF